jgi:hypothetical protein
MCNVHGQYINDVVTPMHGYPVYTINNGVPFKDNKGAHFFGFRTASELKQMIKKSVCDTDDFFFIPCEKNIDFNKYSNDKRVYTNESHVQIDDVYYTGKVYCVETANHTFYVRQHGKEHWTKNCNHPESSTIDLSRIAMNIIELHWEGRTLVGKMEIPITDGFRRLGIISSCADELAHLILSGLKVGVSSRALGGVIKRDGYLEVDDSLELICWDCVSQPSTRNSWITMSDRELQPYIESETKDDSKLIKEDKLSKFESWLND